MQRILVLRGGALGDFIVTLPALLALRRRWPDARLELAGNATAAEIARTRGLVDAVHSQHESRWAPLFGDGPLTDALRAWLATFDLVVNFWPDPDGTLRRHLPVRPAQITVHADAIPAIAPAAAHYAGALRELGVVAESSFCRIEPTRIVFAPDAAAARTDVWPQAVDPDPTPNSQSALRSPQSQIALHPGSGSPRKNWPVERWREVIARLDVPVLLILGEAEMELWGRLAADAGSAVARSEVIPERRNAPSASPTPPVRAVISPPLETLIAELAGCRLFLGHDSGVSHLAAACGLPGILLFGPTDPGIWAPPSPAIRVLRHGTDLSAISVDDVLRAAAFPSHS